MSRLAPRSIKARRGSVVGFQQCFMMHSYWQIAQRRLRSIGAGGFLGMERSYSVQRRWLSAIRRCLEFRAHRRPDHGEHGGNQGKFVLRRAFFLKCS